MPFVNADYVEQAATTAGTADFTLGTIPIGGLQGFSAVGNGNQCYYAAWNGTQREVGIGTYNSAGPTLTRDIILASTSAGAKVNFTTAPILWCNFPAAGAASVVKSVSTNYTLAGWERILEVDCTAGNVTITAPLALGAAALSNKILVSRIDTNVAAQLIINNGSANVDYIVTPANANGSGGGYRHVWSDGTTLRTDGVG